FEPPHHAALCSRQHRPPDGRLRQGPSAEPPQAMTTARVKIRSTTVLAVRRDGKVVIGGDGQVTMGNTVVKASARKIRRLNDGRVIAGFAGSAADGITLFEKFEAKLKDSSSNLMRAAVDLAKDWRTDRALRRLEALLLVADRERTFILSVTGDVIEPDIDAAAVGSGGPYALSAARALLENTTLSAREVADRAMKIAGDICIYTNDQRVF